MRNPFTHKKLPEVKDSAPEFGFGDDMESRFAREALEAEDTGISYYRVKPGRRQAFGHRHEDAEEIYVIIGGDGLLKLDDDLIEVETMDAIRVAPEVTRAFEAGDDGLELIAFGPHHKGDGEIIPGWWQD
jgi:mannose-6-phosphate isomerase-like protein (cupin superfamily)